MGSLIGQLRSHSIERDLRHYGDLMLVRSAPGTIMLVRFAVRYSSHTVGSKASKSFEGIRQQAHGTGYIGAILTSGMYLARPVSGVSERKTTKKLPGQIRLVVRPAYILLLLLPCERAEFSKRTLLYNQ